MELSAFARDAGFQIAWSIARKLGLIPSPGFELAFQAQVQREVGDAPDALGRKNNNPLNLTAPRADYWPGQIGFASGGSAAEPHSDFAVFGTLQEGVEAAAQNYLAPTYKGVQDAIASGAGPVVIAQAIAASPWDSGHYPDLAAQVQELAAQITPVDRTAQQKYDEIASLIQDNVVAPQVDTDRAIKAVLADQAAAIAKLAAAPDHVSDAELAEIVTKIGVGLEKIGA